MQIVCGAKQEEFGVLILHYRSVLNKSSQKQFYQLIDEPSG